ncbi:ribonuclease domain-containing protein [Saccharopolyspora sp. NPDC050642]|uniref:ribonuclease domain-containing protein n=1 Tax=Saccharopolyspora sp. NPDC050642 TaxID=3157099 RepID=UPI0033C804EF
MSIKRISVGNSQVVRLLVACVSFLTLLVAPLSAQAAEGDSSRPCAVDPRTGTQLNIPQAAWDMLSYLQSHNFTPPPGIKGGAIYRNADGKLPALPPPYEYREYDIYPAGPNGRGPERIVTDAALETINYDWYSPDHYQTFMPFIKGRCATTSS